LAASPLSTAAGSLSTTPTTTAAAASSSRAPLPRTCTSYYTWNALTRTNAELVKRQIAVQHAAAARETEWADAGGEIDLEHGAAAVLTEDLRRRSGPDEYGAKEVEFDSLDGAILADDAAASVLPASTVPSLREAGPNTLRKVLTVWDLLAYGISSTLGAGLFVVTGKVASEEAGPAIVFSFLFAGMASLLSAFCYSEFAARIPLSGSAYTFAYVTLGEAIGWFIGWNLTLEYAISGSAVARAWSNYLAAAVDSFVPDFDWSASASALEEESPMPLWLYNYKLNDTFVLSPLTVVIIVIVTLILCLGVKTSAMVNKIMTVLNILIILFVIIVGSTQVDDSNFEPYFPFGWRGIVAGSGTVFFSYIGFDSVTTLAAETQKPERDLPLGVVGTLGISTLLYVAVSTVICGMVKYSSINVSAPLSIAFQQVGLSWAGSIVAIATVTSLTATTLCSIQGQPRVFFAMAEDGLLFKPFGWVNRRTGVPVFGTVVSGILACLLGFFFSLNALTDMISIGTLLAFSVVCAGVILLRYKSPHPETDEEAAARGYFLHPKWIPLVVFLYAVGCFVFGYFIRFELPIWAIVWSGLPSLFFYCVLQVQTQVNIPTTFRCPLVPLVPCIGILVNAVMICGLKLDAIYRVILWSIFGFAIYFGYGIRNSKLNDLEDETPDSAVATLIKEVDVLDPDAALCIQEDGHAHRE